ncbi:PAS domain-containing hybrid sensor histidine kinase/response regulator [Shewanella nanhaiensis]|uniref:histidine kinase n=1 Tax=Shewanella nanhaiensis TaxID=2864872 RepID=A0ABS7E6Q5_9GAMM|nr:PAS domain-containing hybrid sensor histidine kinase/response regulator [Shewanella nanhaiensis]MBW8184692.1 PAS-domain containing protein [Shewanella nanhaiensis]
MSEQSLAEEVARLKLQNSKLEKINQVLMKRVEEGGGNQDEPYAAFEHSVQLAEQVKEKTQALNDTLAQLERSNRALKQANDQANIFKQRFIDAIESISDAFVLLDNDGRIILQNSHFVNFWQKSGLKIEEGVNLNDFKALAKTRGIISQAYPGDADNSPVYKLSDNRWFQLNERRTREGGWVMLYTDITALKVAESERYEKAMAQKSKLLQNLVDNLSQGVVLISSHDQVEVWNKRFVEMSKLSTQKLRSMPYFTNLQSSTELELEPKSNTQEDHYVQTLSNGSVIEIRDHRLKNGKLIKTFTDITTRHKYAESLKKSESWLRLITDNVPAMIAYVGSDLKFQFTNQVYVDWYGWAKGELYGLELEQSRIHGDFIQLQPYVDRALKGESVSFEIEELNSAGEPAHLLKSYVPNRDSTGAVLGFFVLVRDITARRNNALALQKAHDQLELRVKERTSQLQNLNHVLQVEVEERRQAQLNLTAAKSEAEIANISKTKFLAAVSHDLLQPLNAAQLFTSSLAEQVSDIKSFSLLGSISSSLDDLENLISTLVDISKLDAGVVKADKSAFNLGELLNNLANEYQQITDQFGVELRHVSSNAIVHTDSVLLARILRNFLSNAFRYTDKGKVLLGCRRQGDTIVIQVWDNGAGIAKNQLTEIFEEFKRLKSSQTAFSNGLGLGLAIVDKISKVLGHPIQVRSTQGKGSVFSVTVPIGEMSSNHRADDKLSRVLANTDLAGRKIWLIDNDASICDAMSQLLNGWLCEVVTATSLESLKEKVGIKSDSADILIVDYHLDDDVNGLDVAIEINQNRESDLPILMITANYSEELKTKAKKRGILLLNKPVKPMKLKTSILYLLK